MAHAGLLDAARQSLAAEYQEADRDRELWVFRWNVQWRRSRGWGQGDLPDDVDRWNDHHWMQYLLANGRTGARRAGIHEVLSTAHSYAISLFETGDVAVHHPRGRGAEHQIPPDISAATPEQGLARALVAIRQYIRDRHLSGDRLPTASQIAARLDLPYAAACNALRHLDTEGVIAFTSGTRAPRVLKDGEPHPHDAALEQAVRQRVRSGHYKTGQPLPTGLLGKEFHLTSAHTRRACRRLIAEGVLRHDEHGRHGPGLYITAHTPIPDQRKP
ncbi:hypothetical protein [Streptomyces celluloflavus]|uniref:hypothetical protein n=1 Tax=Streptomyces celluloflavus TaxID=58344 RepID=UPI003652950C